ncbi:succinyl-CoA synthetase [Marinitoga sp. 1135]|uniref:Succinyl-CoA synthetase, beta subunit n=1 Tax=Marinitoga piezophila (strain DSM 14283 / JCM 11233 / KA3) TaxID=443254 RepID=H2J7Z0_MARPK|nr:ATP-grasp domain-containing protein [Marinitoga piezophila]AEX85481.1 succinyl-CoA synthetase, beta subunit [Marinitoga piezophila KA3]NUU95694.1 succinyl-CoA synthetase [Marinitoga sp. 1135]NUU97626.1 succinyl-CoA synthetase [Marinitoga sp. 1138]
MKVHEFIGKGFLQDYGIKVPQSYLITSEKDIKVTFLPAVLKSQVLVGGRMKAGGVLFAHTEEEFSEKAKYLLKKEIKGEKPYGVLAEEMIPIKKEYYISLLLNREEKEISILFSESGGIDIEENKDSIIKTNFEKFHEVIPEKIQKILPNLRKLFREKDLTLLEINPLIESEGGEIIALDAVMHLDDNAIFRQTWAEEFVDEKYPFHFVKLEGDIGIIGCGAGIVMATMDAVKLHGGEPADFLDLGGGAEKDITLEALNLLKNSGIKKVILNIFGGITKCDEIARGLVEFNKENPDIQLFIRLTGTNENEAKEILKKHNLNYYEDMYSMILDAVKVGEYK